MSDLAHQRLCHKLNRHAAAMQDKRMPDMECLITPLFYVIFILAVAGVTWVLIEQYTGHRHTAEMFSMCLNKIPIDVGDQVARCSLWMKEKK